MHSQARWYEDVLLSILYRLTSIGMVTPDPLGPARWVANCTVVSGAESGNVQLKLFVALGGSFVWSII